MYATANLKERYRQDYVATASPVDLIIFLYEGCIKQVKLAQIHLKSGSVEKTGAALMRAQDIIIEPIASLDLKFQIAGQLMQIYEYILHELRQMNIHKDFKNAEAVLGILSSLKEAWVDVKMQTDSSFIAEELL
jgi:flagellar protein FliS